jgi:hypothetical protein
MRPVLLCAVSAALGIAAPAGNVGVQENPPADLTIVLDFEGPHSEGSVTAMKREVASLFKSSGLTFDWVLRGEIGHNAFSDLVMIKLKGSCVMDAPSRADASGALALTHTVGTTVLRFSEVQCDKLRTLVRAAARTRSREELESLLGRALGRVIAHELYHMLGNTFAHSRGGIAQPALSGGELISRYLGIDSAELERLQLWRARDAR